ncbi:MAG: VapB-type antitoxin [Thaumarchaeota archaeon]|jgi:bifunctional DNA-binding transcriptional regulator/antitoxin component of YhaV-PrlF toxin-antitoxin module|nr:VapB-type antitoxin [Nitrososphaerota archaeon]
MAIVRVDERGRMTIPREMGIRDTRAVVIPAGNFFITIPLPKAPREEAEGWMATVKDRRQLKKLAESAAKRDAVKRVKRRGQL